MWLVHLTCSDDECSEELELVVENLDDAERAGCSCGHAYVLLSVSEVELV
jgi:hypothetical protein